MSRVLCTALLAATCLIAQEHTPSPQPGSGPQALGDSTGHAQAPMAPSQSHGQEHAQAAAKHGEGHEEAPMPNEIWWKWANFAVLAAGLGYLIGKHGGPFFRSRSEEILKGIADAAQVRTEAEQRASEIERRISNLSGEVENLRAKSREEIAAEGARVHAETQAQIAKIQARAEMEIASAGKNASLELKAYSARLALELAEGQIRQRLDGGAQEGLANAFIQDLRAEKAAASGSVQ